MNPARGENYKFWVFAALAIGLFASVADHGSVGVALPTIAEHFNTDLPTSQWVVIGYALTISAFLLPMGRLADIVGRKKIYLLGTVILITMGIAAGFAPNIGALIAAKLAQGIGSAMTQGTSMAMLIASFPSEERGKALGLQMSVVGTGNVAGPAVGGILVGELGWEWVFFATSIMATVGLLTAYLLIDSRQADRGSAIGQKFDWPGAALSTATLLTFLQTLTWASVLGFDNPAIILSFALFAGAAGSLHSLGTPNSEPHDGRATLQEKAFLARSRGQLHRIRRHVVRALPYALLLAGSAGTHSQPGRADRSAGRDLHDIHGSALRPVFR